MDPKLIHRLTVGSWRFNRSQLSHGRDGPAGYRRVIDGYRRVTAGYWRVTAGYRRVTVGGALNSSLNIISPAFSGRFYIIYAQCTLLIMRLNNSNTDDYIIQYTSI